MYCQIAITGVKPDRLAQLPHMLHAEESIALDAPAALLTQHARQNICDRVDVRRNVQPPPQKIIASIDDQRQVFGSNDLLQAVYELGAAESTRQHRDHAALRA